MLYPRMGSLTARNIGSATIPLETKDDGEEINVGDIQLTPAYTLQGKVELSDGKPIPQNMRVTIIADQGWDAQLVEIAPDGSFEFRALAAGVYSVAPAVTATPPVWRSVWNQRQRLV
jgi:hypothetical protein